MDCNTHSTLTVSFSKNIVGKPITNTMAEYSSGDFTDSSTSNARHRRRQRETDMETDVNTHSSSCRLNRPSTPENATTGQGSGHNEIRLEKTRKVLNIVQNIAAFKPEIEREFDALEEMARRMSLRQVSDTLILSDAMIKMDVRRSQWPCGWRRSFLFLTTVCSSLVQTKCANVLIADSPCAVWFCCSSPAFIL